MIELRHVSKSFHKRDSVAEAVRDINLMVAPREIVAVIGPSGCGKSTLLNMIAGLYAPSRGAVVYKGARVTDVNTDVGYMTQKDNLLPWRSVRDNVAFPLELAGVPRPERAERASRVIAHVGLQGFEERFPSELSGGMRKRACLARMLLYGAETALLDEPFAALDAQTREFMQFELMKILARARSTALFITHQISEAIFLSNRIVVFSARPARVKDIVAVDLPAVRTLAMKHDPDFVALESRIWRLIEEEAARTGMIAAA